jgi:hypothetical protein
VLPAFSPYSGGFDIARGLPADLRIVMGPDGIDGVVITGTSVWSFGPLNRLKRQPGGATDAS